MKKGGLGKSSTVFLVSLLMMWAQAGFSATVSNLSPGVQEEGPSVRQAAPSPGAALADRDGDGLSDGLQARLAKASPTDLFDVIVTFSGPGNAAAAQKAVGPFKVKREFRIISGFAATMTAAQARGLARARGVLRIEEDFRIFAVMNAARRDFGVEKARAFASDNSGVDLTGDGVGICVVDTGVDAGHEQLDGGKVAGFIDYVGGRTAPYDDHGHGTHVSSMAAGDGTGGTNAATYRGVAPGASIYAAKVLNSQGSGSDSDVIAGVEWCAEQPGVDVISMSLGSAGSSDGSDSLSQAVNSAVADGIVAVVAAGNSGDEAGTVGSPGAAEGAITAGAVAEWSAPPGAPNHSEGVYLAPFSSRGPTADGRTKPDITAPGVSITAAEAGTVSGYVTYSGTSMATPFTAGTVALLLQGNPDLSPSDVKRILRSTAQDRGAAGPDNDWGAGLLDVYAAAAKAMGIDVDPPNPFPDWQRISGSVDDNGLWNGTFEVDDTELPIGITLTIDGAPECSLGFLGYCLIWEWSPDLDARLLDPQGNVLAVSTCLNGSECGGIGRQETLHVMPTTTGTYTVQVYPFSDSPNNGKGGAFSLDLSHGPLSGSGGTSPDTTPPSVQSTTPANGATEVPLNSSVTISWDEAVDCNTVNASNVTINQGDWTRQSCSGDTAVFTTGGQSNGTTYTVTVGPDVADLAANTMGTSSSFSFTTLTAPLNTLHVGALDGTATNVNRKFWRANVQITIVDSNNSNNSVSGATVEGVWSGGYSGTSSCTTDSSGQCTVTSKNIKTNVNSETFTVTNVNGSLPYDPQADSNGGTVTVTNP